MIWSYIREKNVRERGREGKGICHKHDTLCHTFTLLKTLHKVTAVERPSLTTPALSNPHPASVFFLILVT